MNAEINKVLAAGSPESQEKLEVISLLDASKLIERIAELEVSLRERHPDYEDLLQIIHRNLSEDEALVHLLSEEQIGVICNGLTKKKQILIVKEATRKSGTGKKVAPSEDDI